MESTVSFGQWVRARRTTLRLTQGELARNVYCSEITIRKIEGDERRPSAEVARGLATHLQLPDDLLPRFLKVARGELNADHLPLLHKQNGRPRHWLPLLSRADLAIPETSFLGRTQEVAQVCELLQQPDLRLLTLVGAPGIGKSRLSLHVAAELSDAFLNGAHFVPLAPLRDSELVPDAIAQIFGFAESDYPTPFDYLRVELRAVSPAPHSGQFRAGAARPSLRGGVVGGRAGSENPDHQPRAAQSGGRTHLSRAALAPTCANPDADGTGRDSATPLCSCLSTGRARQTQLSC